MLCTWAAHRAGLSSAASRKELTPDLDSLPIEVHGHQAGSAANHYFFLVTNASETEVSGLELLERYRKRGGVTRPAATWR